MRIPIARRSSFLKDIDFQEIGGGGIPVRCGRASWAGIPAVRGEEARSASGAGHTLRSGATIAGEQIIDAVRQRDLLLRGRGTARIVSYSAAGRAVSFDESTPAAYSANCLLDSQPRSASVAWRSPHRWSRRSRRGLGAVILGTRKIAVCAADAAAGQVIRQAQTASRYPHAGRHQPRHAGFCAREERQDGEHKSGKTSVPVPNQGDIAPGSARREEPWRGS